MKYKVIKKRPWWPEVGRAWVIKEEQDMDGWYYEIFQFENSLVVIDLNWVNIEEYFAEVKQLPKSWNEGWYVEWWYVDDESKPYRTECGNTELLECYKSTRPTKELAEASIALAQLMQLRDVYRDWWKPSEQDKWRVCWCDRDADMIYYRVDSLNMPTKELRDQFQENFSELIEQAKPLFYS